MSNAKTEAVETLIKNNKVAASLARFLEKHLPPEVEAAQEPRTKGLQCAPRGELCGVEWCDIEC